MCVCVFNALWMANNSRYDDWQSIVVIYFFQLVLFPLSKTIMKITKIPQVWISTYSKAIATRKSTRSSPHGCGWKSFMPKLGLIEWQIYWLWKVVVTRGLLPSLNSFGYFFFAWGCLDLYHLYQRSKTKLWGIYQWPCKGLRTFPGTYHI